MVFNSDITTLTQCPVPPSTDTYTAVPHIDIHDKVLEVLNSKSISIIHTEFKSNRKGTQVIAIYHLDMGNGDFNGMLAWRNSYDKTRSVAIVSGCSVWICSNGSVMGEMKFLHKHTGTVDEMLQEAIEEQIGKIQVSIDSTEFLKESLEQLITIPHIIGEVVGCLYLDSIINTSQLEIIKKELITPSFNYGSTGNMWVLFNHITHALKTSPPSDYFENHIKLVNYFKETWINDPT